MDIITTYGTMNKQQHILTVKKIPAFLIKISGFENRKVLFTLCEPINPTAAHAVMDWIRQSFDCQANKGQTLASDFDLSIQKLDSTGFVIEEKPLPNAFATNATFHDCYGDYAVTDIDLEVTFG